MTVDRPTASDIPTVPSGAALSDLPGPRLSLVVYFREGATVFPLPPGAAIVIGRGRPADLVLNDPSLSRQHARFLRIGDEVHVEDLGSTNGTRVKGKRIQRTRIRIGDAVWLGAVAVTLHALGAAEAELHGVESYEAFVAALEEEVRRARTFERPIGVLLLRAEGRTPVRLDRWCPRVRSLLRPVDRLALYGPNALLACLLESGAQRTEELAHHVVASQREPPAMLCGFAVFPDAGAGAEELIAAVAAATQRATPRRPVAGAAPALAAAPRDVVVVSPRMQEIYRLAKRVAGSDIPVLVQGETGVGKELVAQAIHENSPRKRKPLRSINCGAIPSSLLESTLFGHERGAFTGADRQRRGLFEEADGGTLLLDEIGELSEPAQAALLRVLETHRLSRVGSAREIVVDVRVLAATHRDLEEMAQAGRFRADLLYRLNTMVINVPPLRERPEEILPLAEHFARRACQTGHRKTVRLDPSVAASLRAYSWPGNVRELRNAIERAVVLAVDDVVTVEELPERVRSTGTAAAPPLATPPQDIRGTLDQVEAQLLLDALQANGWNQSRTAEALGMPRRTLVYKLRRYGIRRKDAP